MNRKQITVLWIGGVLLAIAFVMATYDVRYSVRNPIGGRSVLDEIGDKSWQVSRVTRPDIIASKMIRYMPPILIISGLLIYSLKSKRNECDERISPNKKSC